MYLDTFSSKKRRRLELKIFLFIENDRSTSAKVIDAYLKHK